MKQLLLATLAVLGILLAVPPARADSITLPSYAQGSDLRGALESRGKAISDLLAFVAGIVGIIGIIVGAIKMGAGDPEGGKRQVLWGSLGILKRTNLAPQSRSLQANSRFERGLMWQGSPACCLCTAGGTTRYAGMFCYFNEGT